MIDFRRIFRHVVSSRRRVRRAFPDVVLDRLEAAVHAGEELHDGEVRFAVETELGWPALLAGVTPRERALEVFSLLRVWDTARNNGVLIYLLFADRDVEIVADRGFEGIVSAAEWERICAAMRSCFARGEFEAGALAGIEAASALMASRFPSGGRPSAGEMPDRPVLL